MTNPLGIAVLILATCISVPAHAARKRNAGKNSGASFFGTGPTAGTSGPPSARIEPLLQPCLDAILEPLERDPGMPRVEVEKLRSAFAVGRVTARTLPQQQIFQNAMTVCEALTRGMDDRAAARSSAQASATVPSVGGGAGNVHSMPMRGWDAGALGEAIRKKQKDERNYSDKKAKEQSTFVGSVAYRSWTDRAVYLRRNVMALYTRQVQLEALDQRNTPPPSQSGSQSESYPPPSERPAKSAAKSNETGKPAPVASYAGVWKSDDGRVGTFVLQRDQTGLCIRSQDLKSASVDSKGKWILTKVGDEVSGRVGNFLSWVGGEPTEGRKGKWNVNSNGMFEFKFESGEPWVGAISPDGQTLYDPKTKVRFRRQAGVGVKWFDGDRGS